MKRLLNRAIAIIATVGALATLAVTISPSVSAQMPGGPAKSTMTGGFLFPGQAVTQARAWAEQLTCEGAGCDPSLEIAVIASCRVPVFLIRGSFIVREAHWQANQPAIQQAMGPGTSTLLTQNYRLIQITGTRIPQMRNLQAAGIDITPNFIHYAQPLWRFLPHAGPVPIPDRTEGFDPGHFAIVNSTDAVVSIDTGVRPTGNVDLNHTLIGTFGENEDQAPVDDATGHGPAIADLIGDMFGLAESPAARGDSALRQVQIANGAIGGELVHPDGARGVDQASVLATLDSLNPATVDIVNLSMGAKSCPALTVREVTNPVTGAPMNIQTDPIRQWLIDNPTITMVASAGNSGSNRRTFPAAWTRDPAVPNILSIGSMGEDGTRSCFSDFGVWVDYYAVGQDVTVEHPIHGLVAWSGTSFSAPQVTAAIAAGKRIRLVAEPRNQVPPPSMHNQQWCNP